MFEEEYENLHSGNECDSCLYEKVLCLQEGTCLMCSQEVFWQKNIKRSIKKMIPKDDEREDSNV